MNALIEALNTRDCLLKLLIIILDKDMIENIDLPGLHDHRKTQQVISTTVTWLIRQMNIIIRRKRAKITEHKPGAVYSDDPKMIFVRMLRRFEHQPRGTRLEKIYSHRAKFNDTLNDVVAEISQYMLTINLCNTLEHYNHWGKLSAKGQRAYWAELDELVEKFDLKKI